MWKYVRQQTWARQGQLCPSDLQTEAYVLPVVLQWRMVGVPEEVVRMCSVWSCGVCGNEWSTPGWTTPTTGWDPSSSAPTWITWITSCSDFSRLARGSPDSSAYSSKSLSMPLVSSEQEKEGHCCYSTTYSTIYIYTHTCICLLKLFCPSYPHVVSYVLQIYISIKTHHPTLI